MSSLSQQQCLLFCKYSKIFQEDKGDPLDSENFESLIEKIHFDCFIEIQPLNYGNACVGGNKIFFFSIPWAF